MACAKFLFHEDSKADPGDGDKSYFDVEVIKELRRMTREAAARSKVSPRVSDEAKKWLDWPSFIDCVGQLKEECCEV